MNVHSFTTYFFPAERYRSFGTSRYTQTAGMALVLMQHIGFLSSVNPGFEFTDEGQPLELLIRNGRHGQHIIRTDIHTGAFSFAGIQADERYQQAGFFFAMRLYRHRQLFSGKPTAKKQPAQALIGRLNAEDGERLRVSGECLNLSIHDKATTTPTYFTGSRRMVFNFPGAVLRKSER